MDLGPWINLHLVFVFCDTFVSYDVVHCFSLILLLKNA